MRFRSSNHITVSGLGPQGLSKKVTVLCKASYSVAIAQAAVEVVVVVAGAAAVSVAAIRAVPDSLNMPALIGVMRCA